MSIEKERISTQYQYNQTNSSVNENQNPNSSVITEIPSNLENFIKQSRTLDYYILDQQYEDRLTSLEDDSIRYAKVKELCSQFISKSKEVFMKRKYECCSKHFFRQKVYHTSDQISSMTVEFPRTDCVGSFFRCIRDLFFEHKDHLQAASSIQDELRIQVFGKAKLGLVTIGGIPIGRFEAIQPAICRSIFCSASIQVEVEAFFGERSQITIERDAEINQLCMETLCYCICCAFNKKQMRIYKNGNQVNTFSVSRSSFTHFVQLFCSSCINANWEVTQISIGTHQLNDIEKVLILASWIYQIEHVK